MSELDRARYQAKKQRVSIKRNKLKKVLKARGHRVSSPRTSRRRTGLVQKAHWSQLPGGGHIPSVGKPALSA